MGVLSMHWSEVLPLVSLLRCPDKLAKKQVFEELLPKQLVFLQVTNTKHRKRHEKKKQKEIFIYLFFLMKDYL